MDNIYDWINFLPNEQQRQAIDHSGGPLQVIAGPGSGKTRVNSLKCVKMIVCEEVPSDQIYVATFSNKAAKELEFTVNAYLSTITMHTGKKYDITNLYIGTVHSLCTKLLLDRRIAPDRFRVRVPKIMNELNQYFFVKQGISNFLTKASLTIEQLKQQVEILLGKRINNRHDLVKGLMEIFNRFSEESINIELILKSQTEIHHLFGLLYGSYLADLKKNNMIDLSLLQQKTVEFVYGNLNANNVFHHILVDEYQDTNPVQEKLFFELAKGKQNITVVGDDDQSLYRFRGADIGCFVDFPKKVKESLGRKTDQIELTDNYRSLKGIVDFYRQYINSVDWRKEGSEGEYRIQNKEVIAKRKDIEELPSVIKTSEGTFDQVAVELASFVNVLIDSKKVNHLSDIAFLFPSLKSKAAQATRQALNELGINVYAPRAGKFLDSIEAKAIFGLFGKILGLPNRLSDEFGGRYQVFVQWLNECNVYANVIVENDPTILYFIEQKRIEILRCTNDYVLLIEGVSKLNWDLSEKYDTEQIRDSLFSISGLSIELKHSLLHNRWLNKGNYTLGYIMSRFTSLDWSLLDLFYQLIGFTHFKEVFQEAEAGENDESIMNLAKITHYISHFMDINRTIISGRDINDGFLSNNFFINYLYSLHLLEEPEVEFKEGIFPKNRVLFLTIHQSKGLEFPVVILGNTGRKERNAGMIEQMIRHITRREGEPLERIHEFDTTRMFYVALSRAENLLVVANAKGRGITVQQPFKQLIRENNEIPNLNRFNVNLLPEFKSKDKKIPRVYSYTSDYLLYKQCPRYFMLYREYGFVPSRSQTILFGSVVHRTVEDLHNFLISKRSRTV